MLTRKTVILAKIETTYGIDPTPTPVANALLVKDVDIKPSGELVERDFLRSSLSPIQFVRGIKEVDVSFTTELKGTGIAGSLPAWGWEGVLFRGCGMKETITGETTVEVTPGEDNAGNGTLTNCEASPTAVSETWTVTCIVAETNRGIFSVTGAVSGAKAAATVGIPYDNGKISFIINDGLADFNLGDTFSIVVTVTPGAKIEYLPISEDSKSVTLYVYKDGVFHKITGCRGTFTINGSVGKYLEIKWSFKGLYQAPTDVSPDTQTFSSVIPPLLFSAGLKFDAYSPVATSIEIAMNNDLGKRQDLSTATGLKEIMITGRKPGGSLDPETVTEATYAFWNKWETAAAAALNIGPIGSVSGNIITITAPKMQYQEITYADREGLLTYKIPFRLAMNSGDDELKITIT